MGWQISQQQVRDAAIAAAPAATAATAAAAAAAAAATYAVLGKGGMVFDMSEALGGKINTHRQLWCAGAYVNANAKLLGDGSVQIRSNRLIKLDEEIFYPYGRIFL